VLFVGESAGRREALSDLLHHNGLRPKPFEHWQDFLASKAKLGIATAPLTAGLASDDVTVITEAQLFGERARVSRRKRRDTRDADAIIRNLTDLSIGAPVVHIDHGVGRYQGLVRLDVGGVEAEFLMLTYSGDDKLYVPVSSLQLISRYTGSSEEGAPLHKLGGEQWTKIKKKAAEKARDVAAELLEIHARRAARRGHAFPAQSGNYDDFAAAFPFEETPDQAQAIEAVLEDMRREQPMDRVVCGDVGFGKTEVAMRAAFAAVDGGKQVAVLVPTTLLAQQHHNNFSDRFADWPVRIESLSRFRTKKQQDDVIADLKAGKVDIVIGTHKLLQAGINFANLGLVIVDEEHRFGVRHKERLKALRAEVDLLTLTATPIPRTLNMSLAGLRELSIIATPPAHRHAIKTFVSEWSDQQIREACQRELSRGGQVYVLHNEVKSIERIARQIEEIVPQATVRFAHGQMHERELEAAMLDFYHQRFNVLVATTIIESGIDIPTANTIIINRADKLGLAQLHQLRGRVGRSHHRAYAYLLVPPKSAISPDAQKRLEAIESLEDLGVGFTLATHDLEIRGAGELLGEGQSGQIHEVGFSLYSDLLDRAVKALKRGELPDADAPLAAASEVELQLPALLPDDYVPDIHTRLILYKRIASAEDAAALRELKVELIDRFGLLPDATKNLFAATELKLRSAALGIRKLEAAARGGRILFEAKPNIDPLVLIKLVQFESKIYRFDGTDVLRFAAELDEPQARIDFLDQLLARFEAAPPQENA
jgi:transcription-repair coupling factor (superfamily II helicase)